MLHIVWLWINIGSHKRSEIDIIGQMQKALSAYNADADTKNDFASKLIRRMNRVADEADKTSAQYKKIYDWVEYSKLWIIENEAEIKSRVG